MHLPCIRAGLLFSGMFAAILYLVADMAGGLSWPGYSFSAQTISELSALEAPSRSVVVPIFTLHNILLVAFAAGILMVTAEKALRITAVTLVAIAAAGLTASAFGSMHIRGNQPMAATDMLHIALTIVTVACIFVGVGFSASAFGPGFRLYALATVVVMLVFGVLAALDGPRIAQNLATPWVGITERINVYAYDLWVAMLSVALLRRTRTGPVKP